MLGSIRLGVGLLPFVGQTSPTKSMKRLFDAKTGPSDGAFTSGNFQTACLGFGGGTYRAFSEGVLSS